MPGVLEIVPNMHEKPHPKSLDSGHEHSLDHWLEVYWLVEEDYAFAKDNDSEPHASDSPIHQAAG